MVRFRFILLASALVLSSCVKEQLKEQKQLSADEFGTMSITATVEGAETKTTLSGLSVQWEKGDEITVFFDGTPSTFIAQSAGLSAIFVGKGNPDASSIYALYPSNPDASISGDEITFSKDLSSQVSKDASFGSGTNIAIGKYSGGTIKFKNLGAYAEFYVPSSAANIDHAVLSSTSGEPICIAGEAVAKYNGGEPILSSSSTVSSISLKSESGFKDGVKYYFWVRPCELSKGVTLELFNSTGGSCNKTGSTAYTFKRNTIANLGETQFALTSGLPVGWNFYDDIYLGQYLTPAGTDHDYSWSYGNGNNDVSKHPCSGVTPCSAHKVYPNKGAMGTEAFITCSVANVSAYDFSPSIQVQGMKKGDYFLARIPVSNLPKGTNITVKACFGGASSGAGNFVMKYSSNGSQYYVADGWYYLSSSPSTKVHYEVTEQNSATSLRKTLYPLVEDGIKTYTFPLTSISSIGAKGALFLKFEVAADKRAGGSSESIASGAWCDLKFLEVSLPSSVLETKTPEKGCATKIVAHRGGYKESGLPSNSIMGLTFCSGLHCYAAEADLLATKDKRVLVCHPTDDYYVNGLDVRSHTLAEIRAAGKLANGEEIPIVEDYVAWAQDSKLNPNKMHIYLDVKDISNSATAIEESYKIIKAADATEFFEYLAPNYNVRKKMDDSALYSDGKCKLGYQSVTSPSNYVKYFPNLSYFHVVQVTGAPKPEYSIDDFYNAGKQLGIYFTGSDYQYGDEQEYETKTAPYYEKLKSLMTNYPYQYTQYLKSLGKIK